MADCEIWSHYITFHMYVIYKPHALVTLMMYGIPSRYAGLISQEV